MIWLSSDDSIRQHERISNNWSYENICFCLAERKREQAVFEDIIINLYCEETDGKSVAFVSNEKKKRRRRDDMEKFYILENVQMTMCSIICLRFCISNELFNWSTHCLFSSSPFFLSLPLSPSSILKSLFSFLLRFSSLTYDRLRVFFLFSFFFFFHSWQKTDHQCWKCVWISRDKSIDWHWC